MDLSLKIDIVEDISVDDFKRQYLIPQKPLLIKGGIIKKTEAYRKWSIDFFKKEMGTLKLIFTITQLSNQKQPLSQVAI